MTAECGYHKDLGKAQGYSRLLSPNVHTELMTTGFYRKKLERPLTQGTRAPGTEEDLGDETSGSFRRLEASPDPTLVFFKVKPSPRTSVRRVLPGHAPSPRTTAGHGKCVVKDQTFPSP